MKNPSILPKDEKKAAFLHPFTLNGLGKGAEAKRQDAVLALGNLSLPTRKTEDWKYTPLRAVQKRRYSAYTADIQDIKPFLIPNLEADLLVFVNGQYQESLSSIALNQGILEVSPIHALNATQKEVFEANFGSVVPVNSDIFAALNTAYSREGVLVFVPKGKIAKAPIHILHLSQAQDQPLGMQHRNLVVVGTSAEAKIVETTHSLGIGPSFRNACTEIIIGDNAGLEYIKLQRESDEATQVDRTEVMQGKDSRFSIYTLTFGGELMRNNLWMRLHGEHIESHLLGFYLLDGKQHVDNFTTVDHTEPNGFSNELYKGIMDEQSTGVFRGRIHVFEDAQQTNAYQSNRNIVLTDTAHVFTQPQLEIYADDVKCSHGATTGRMDESAMFYLMSRGIPEARARKMLVHAFAMEVADNISLEAVKEHVSHLIDQRY